MVIVGGFLSDFPPTVTYLCAGYGFLKSIANRTYIGQFLENRSILCLRYDLESCNDWPIVFFFLPSNMEQADKKNGIVAELSRCID